MEKGEVIIMINVIMSENDLFNLYVPATRRPDVAYVEFLLSDRETDWKLCPIVKLIDTADYGDVYGNMYYDEAQEKMINNAKGITGEIISDDYIIYIEADVDNGTALKEPPELNIVGYC